MKVILAAMNSKYVHTALGLRYIGEYAKEQGHDITLIEETINTPVLAVLEKLMAAAGDVYGFSVHIWNKLFVFRLIRMLKKLRPQAKIVIGGPEVAFDAEKIFAELPEADYIIQGEGEIIFEALLQQLENDDTEVPQHVAYKDSNGKIMVNGGVTVIDDLSILPFPYPDLEKIISEHKIVYYECSRGCPFNCSYCLSGISRNVRRRPLAMVLADLDRFMEAGVPLVKFVDRTYNLDESYFLPIMQYLAQADTATTFHFEIKADILSSKVLEFFKSVPKGRFQLEIGVQSTHQQTLTAINRKDNWENLAANVQQILANDNMHVHLDLIAGLPFESISEFEQSFNDVYGLQPQMLQLGFLKVLPGTQMSKETAVHELLYMDEPPYEILSTKYMPYQEMQFLKQLESVFEQTYNTGYFHNILQQLIELHGNNSFDFYRVFTSWWVAKGYYPQSHNVKGTAEIIGKYINDTCGDKKDFLLEILKYDVFSRLPGWKPEWLSWNSALIFDRVSEFWRDEEKVLQYVPDYKFSSWRQINKMYPIERFSYDPVSKIEGEIYLMADCSGAEPKIINIIM